MFGDSMCDRHPEDWGLYVHFILHSLLSPIFFGLICLFSSLLRSVSLSALSSLLSISFSSSAYGSPVRVTCSSQCIRGIASRLTVSPVVVQSENGTISDLREICKDCRW